MVAPFFKMGGVSGKQTICCKHFLQFPETSTLEKYRVTSLLCLPLISRGFKELFSCPFSRGAYPYSNAVLSHFTCTLWDLPKVPPAKAIQPAVFQPKTTIPPVSSCDHPDDPVIPIISRSLQDSANQLSFSPPSLVLPFLFALGEINVLGDLTSCHHDQW